MQTVIDAWEWMQSFKVTPQTKKKQLRKNKKTKTNYEFRFIFFIWESTLFNFLWAQDTAAPLQSQEMQIQMKNPLLISKDYNNKIWGTLIFLNPCNTAMITNWTEIFAFLKV